MDPTYKLNEPAQLKLLEALAPYVSETTAFPIGTIHEKGFCLSNPNYGDGDAQSLWCMLRHFKPKRIIEVGSGWSTHLIRMALDKNGVGHLMAIDPAPRTGIGDAPHKFLQMGIEGVPIDTFKELRYGDVLFIDVPYGTKVSGAIVDLYDRVIPALGRGVLVHFHDTFLPDGYPLPWQGFHPDAQEYWERLLEKGVLEVVWASKWMHKTHPEKVELVFQTLQDPHYRNMPWPEAVASRFSNFWTRKT